jgi:hypothetical protein
MSWFSVIVWRFRDEFDARYTLQIRGDCKLHTAFVVCQSNETAIQSTPIFTSGELAPQADGAKL